MAVKTTTAAAAAAAAIWTVRQLFFFNFTYSLDPALFSSQYNLLRPLHVDPPGDLVKHPEIVPAAQAEAGSVHHCICILKRPPQTVSVANVSANKRIKVDLTHFWLRNVENDYVKSFGL